ncbi:hypothetical protein CLV67_11854 [Actinoplanes italicus]|uniref:Uncharacterized protein n=1 Tax=Actinoplanes italicus TaxID=113567 RepID=A0A2T0K2B6_9ACTN|nr:hypothetical protein CLV67_11854 [Actinoplanes italicus]
MLQASSNPGMPGAAKIRVLRIGRSAIRRSSVPVVLAGLSRERKVGLSRERRAGPSAACRGIGGHGVVRWRATAGGDSGHRGPASWGGGPRLAETPGIVGWRATAGGDSRHRGPASGCRQSGQWMSDPVCGASDRSADRSGGGRPVKPLDVWQHCRGEQTVSPASRLPTRSECQPGQQATDPIRVSARPSCSPFKPPVRQTRQPRQAAGPAKPPARPTRQPGQAAGLSAGRCGCPANSPPGRRRTSRNRGRDVGRLDRRAAGDGGGGWIRPRGRPRRRRSSRTAPMRSGPRCSCRSGPRRRTCADG